MRHILQDYLDEHQIDARLLTDIGDTPTVAAAAEALGVETSQIVKTLLFLVSLPDIDAPQPVVVISHDTGRIDVRVLSRHYGVGRKKVAIAPGDVVLELLGYPPGGVPPIGHRTQLPIIMDASLLALADAGTTQIYAGGGDDKTMMAIAIDTLQALTDPLILPVSRQQ